MVDQRSARRDGLSPTQLPQAGRSATGTARSQEHSHAGGQLRQGISKVGNRSGSPRGWGGGGGVGCGGGAGGGGGGRGAGFCFVWLVVLYYNGKATAPPPPPPPPPGGGGDP